MYKKKPAGSHKTCERCGIKTNNEIIIFNLTFRICEKCRVILGYRILTNGNTKI